MIHTPLCSPPTQKKLKKKKKIGLTMAELTEFESKKSEKNLVSIIEIKKNEGLMLLSTILEKFGLNWKPESSSQTEEGIVQTTTTKIGADGEIVSKKPGVVTFPDAVAVRRQDFSALNLKVEESEQGGGRNQLWPVYALGGFMIAKWMWARWQEAKAKKPDPPSGGEEPSLADD